MHQDRYLSLQSAFWYAGVHFTIGSYWPVRDEVALEFAKSFYTQLYCENLDNTLNTRDSIYLSWVKAVGSLREKFPNPIDWSAYQLIGY